MAHRGTKPSIFKFRSSQGKAKTVIAVKSEVLGNGNKKRVRRGLPHQEGSRWRFIMMENALEPCARYLRLWQEAQGKQLDVCEKGRKSIAPYVWAVVSALMLRDGRALGKGSCSEQ